jgi:hypothetical protein
MACGPHACFYASFVSQPTREGVLLKRIIIGLVCGAVLLPLAPSTAMGAIKIDRIYFDSPGSDTGSNSSLNAEWIR